MKYRKIYLVLFLLTLISILVSCSSINFNPQNALSTKKDETEKPSIHIEGFNIIETFKGIKEWNLNGKNADIFEEKDLINIISIDMTFYDSTQPLSNLKAEEADLNMKSKNVLAKRNVIVKSTRNVVLETEQLTWNSEQKMFETDAPVKITRSSSILTGIGLKTGAGLENIKILKDVKVKTLKTDALGLFEKGKK